MGNFKRRKKIRDEWYFDCECKRCSDPTECGSNISAIMCHECFDGIMLPVNSLDYESIWRCKTCGFTLDPEAVESMVDAIEQELDEIGNSGNFAQYEDFLEKYSGTMLHDNHYLLMIAAR